MAAYKTEVNQAWKHLPNIFNNWRLAILPGLTLTGLIIAARLLGMFQSVEWRTLDLFLRLRPTEAIDERVLIVAIDETDIQQLGSPIVPDKTLAKLLRQLDQYQPRAVGIDILRDFSIEPGHQEFVEALTDLPYVYGIEFLGQSGKSVAPPPALPYERVGFSDFPLDSDGSVRRTFLGRYKESGNYQFSLAIRLATHYLQHEEILLENGLRNPDALRFGKAELPMFYANTGGYVRANDGGQQTLINVRRGHTPFQIVFLRDVLKGEVSSSEIRDRIVLIGITSAAHKDFVTSGALIDRNPGTVPGVEMHAHAISQILSATLDERPLLHNLPDIGEYLWIALWGAAGILLVKVVPTPSRHLIVVLVIGAGLVLASYAALLTGLWLPVEPPLIAFLLNGLVLPGILLYDQMLRSRIEEGQRVINRTFDAVHNGPLQSLVLMLRDIEKPNREITITDISPRLQQLDQEIRDIYDALEQEIEPQNDQLYLPNSGVILELSISLHDLLYQVFEHTIKRDFPNLKSIKANIVQFDPMKDNSLNIEEKRDLCRFLEERLCNVGKHAEGCTRLKVTCLATDNENVIVVEDNGQAQPQESSRDWNRLKGGRGNRQARKLAKRLKGQFKQFSVSPHGTCCELRWPIY
ncbi:MAG: CHASE2 domain-containing protein [Cyanobacteria bacterium P01_B01_bin.77]